MLFSSGAPVHGETKSAAATAAAYTRWLRTVRSSVPSCVLPTAGPASGAVTPYDRSAAFTMNFEPLLWEQTALTRLGILAIYARQHLQQIAALIREVTRHLATRTTPTKTDLVSRTGSKR